MKSLMIKNLLLEFCKINKVKWKKTRRREMDKSYETLISNQQPFKIKDIKSGIGKIFIIQPMAEINLGSMRNNIMGVNINMGFTL